MFEEDEPEDYDFTETELAELEAINIEAMQYMLNKSVEQTEPRPKTRRDTIPEGYDFYRLFG